MNAERRTRSCRICDDRGSGERTQGRSRGQLSVRRGDRGAGHNGLVCALYLARAGWKTLVLERNEGIGGTVMSGEVTRPGFVHDLYSMNQNLFLGSSPVYAELKEDLERHGLRYRTSSKPYCNVFPDGRSLRVYRDRDRTRGLKRSRPAGLRGLLTALRALRGIRPSVLAYVWRPAAVRRGRPELGRP